MNPAQYADELAWVPQNATTSHNLNPGKNPGPSNLRENSHGIYFAHALGWWRTNRECGIWEH